MHFLELFHFQKDQNKHCLGQFQYNDLINKRDEMHRNTVIDIVRYSFSFTNKTASNFYQGPIL